MKVLVALLLLAVVALSVADSDSDSPAPLYPRGCIWVNGKCWRGCEVGTHSYTSACGPKMPEATCDEPNPVRERGSLCDYTACYCDAPTVRDKSTNKCVNLDECPKKENVL